MRASRAQLVAFVAAGLALAVATVAVIVVLTRDPASPAAGAPAVAVEDGTIEAADLVALREQAVTAATGGVTLADAAALGVGPGDVIVSMAGRPTRDEDDVRAVLTGLALEGSTEILFVELQRGPAAAVRRLRIDGDLHDAWVAAHPRPTPVDPAASLALLTPDPSAAGVTPSVPAVDDADLAAIVDGITEVDETHYTVKRSAVDKLLANPMAAAKGARVVPAMKNGKPDGFKLYAIRPSSLYAKLGLKNGDTVQRVNDFELTTADKALEVYTKLRTAKKLVVEVVRRGKPVTLHYKIR